MSRRSMIFAVVATLSVAAALCVDAPVASFVHRHRWDNKQPGTLAHIREYIKMVGFYPVTVMISVFAGALHPMRWRASLFLLLATLPTATNEVIKVFAGRYRPFRGIDDVALIQPMPFAWHPFSLPLEKVFHPPQNLCFPSGHTALAFATAAVLSILFPRRRWLWFGGALIVGIERVTENAHWTSDAVCGALLGMLCVFCVARIWPRHREGLRLHG